MNCQKGDLARILTPGPFQDRIIRVTEYIDGLCGPEWYYEGQPFSATMSNGEDGWQLTFFDRVLRPIRGLPGTDEVLRYAGHPLSQSHRERAESPKRQVEHSR
jgi:hypothetical protein